MLGQAAQEGMAAVALGSSRVTRGRALIQTPLGGGGGQSGLPSGGVRLAACNAASSALDQEKDRSSC